MDEAQRKKDEQDMTDLVLKVSALCDAAGDHWIALHALLAVFMGIAVAHPCCTRHSANAAIDVGAKLLTRSTQAGPSSNHFH